MELIIELLPVVIFFSVFKWQNLTWATIAAIIVNLLLLVLMKYRFGKFSKLPMIASGILLVLGSFGLIYKKEIFIKWKPTVVYWGLAIILLSNYILGKNYLFKNFANQCIKLPQHFLGKLHLIWAIFFIAMGILNLYIVYHYDTNTWVNFKLFGTFGLTILFVGLQYIFLVRYLVNNS